MHQVTQILASIEVGNHHAAAELLPLVYDELRKLAKVRMAHERSDHTLQSTALVHEAFVRLVVNGKDVHWESRGHFFAAAAEAMRRILIESARGKRSQKRGGERHRQMSDVLSAADDSTVDSDLLIDIDEGLTRLAVEDALAAELVKLRLFAGLSITEAGEMLGVSRSEAYRIWDFVRAWFSVNFTDSANS